MSILRSYYHRKGSTQGMLGDPISKQCGLLVTETNVLRVYKPQQAAIVLKSPAFHERKNRCRALPGAFGPSHDWIPL